MSTLLLCLFLLISCGGDTTNITEDNEPTLPTNTWSDANQETYIRICLDAGATFPQCDCTLKYLEARFQTSDDWTQAVASGEFGQEETIEMVKECA